MELAVILFVGGAVVMLWLYLWVRQRQQLGRLPELETNAQYESHGMGANDAVVVASQSGQIIYVNENARQIFGLETVSLDLEDLAALAQPPDSFLNLFTGAGQSAFQIGSHWIEGASHQIPSDEGLRTVLVLRDLGGAGVQSDALNLGKAVELVAEIGETINVGLGVETTLQALLNIVRKSITTDAGEICLWNPETRTLTPRGWVGAAAYVLALAEIGGVYREGEGITGWIAAKRQPVLVADKRALDAVQPLLPESAYHSFAGVPLILGERFIGTFELSSIKANNFTPADIALLQAIAKPIATAIYNAEIYSEQQRRIQDLAGLQQIDYDPENTETIDQALGAIVERVATLSAAEQCGVLLYDERRDALVAQEPFFGLPTAVASNYAISASTGSLARLELLEADSWFSDDLRAEADLDGLGMAMLAFTAGVKNTAVVPLIVGIRRIGLLQVSNKRGGGGFSRRDMDNLRLMASQVAVLIEDMRLAQTDQQRETEMTAVQEITQALGTLTREQEFYASATERIARLMGVQYCGVLLFDAETRDLRARRPFFGFSAEQAADYRIPLEPGTAIERIWQQEDTWFTNKAVTDKVIVGAGMEEQVASLGIHQTLLAVMETGGSKVGIIQIANHLNGEDFTDKDGRLLYIFAAQIASLIENSRLFREAQRRADESESLRQIAELSNKILTTEDDFSPTLAVVARFMECQSVYISVLDQSAGTLTTAPRYIFGIEIDRPIVVSTYGKAFEYSVAISRQPFMSNDVLNDKRVLPVYRELAQELSIRQSVLVPLVVGDHTLGEMGVTNSKHGGFTEEDVKMLSAIGVQVASALDRVRIYELTGQNLSRRLQELDAISRVSNELAQTLDFETVLDVARLEAARAADADGNTVAILQPASEWRQPEIPELERRLGERKPAEGLSEIELAAIRAGIEAVIIDDYATSELQPTPADARSALAAAFTYEEQVIGVFHLYSRQPHHFDERAATFLMTLASKASLSYGNNLRYLENQDRSNRLRRRVEQLNQIFELGQMLQHNVDPVTMLEAIAYSIQQSCGYDTVLMTLLDDRGGEPVFRRLAQAGLPIDAFEQSKGRVMPLSAFDTLVAKDAFRISESLFLPFDKLKQWHVDGLETFSAQFTGQRTLHPHAREQWRDGDMLLVPIRGVTGEVLGLMSLDRPQDGRRPERGAVEVLEIFAHQAAATIENNRLYLASLRSAEQEARLNEVMEAISSTLDLNQIVEGVAQGVLRLLPFQHMTLALVDNEQDGFDLIRVSVTPDNAVVIGRDHLPTLENTSQGRTFTDGKDYLYHADTETDADYTDLHSWQAEGERTTLVIPLITGGFVAGSMHIGSNLVHAFGFDEYRPLIKRIANLTAVAVQNARLFGQAVNLRLFNESIFQSIQQGLIVLDRSGKILIANDFIRRRYGFNEDAAGQDLFYYRPDLEPILRESFKSVIETTLPAELNDVRLTLHDELMIQNFSVYPLLSNDFARGAVVLVDDVTERARLERDIAARSSQLEALTEASRRITAALERDEVIELAFDEMQRVIGYDSMSVWSRSGDEFVIEAARGFDLPPDPIHVPVDDSKKLRSILERQRALSADVTPNDSIPGISQTKSWLGVPLVRQGQVMGMITLASSQPEIYDSRSEHAAVAFANQVAVALANADLFAEAVARTQRLSLLNRVSMSLAQSLDIENILEVSLREVAGVLGIENARAFIFERDTNLARAIVEMPRGDSPPEVVVEVDKAPIMQRIWRRPQTIIVENVDDISDAELELELLKKGVSAYLLIPMSIGGQTSGVFELEAFNGARKFEPEKVDLAVIIASQAAIHILNASLLEQTLVRTRELETLLEAAQATSTTLDLNEVFQSVVRLTIQALDVDDCAVMIYDNVEERLIVQVSGNRNDDPARAVPAGLEYDLFQYTAKTRALRDGQVIVIRSDEVNSDRIELEEMHRLGDTSRMLVPLVVGDASIGLLQVSLQSFTRSFTHRDMRMAQALGAQAGAAVENARLSTETSSQVAQSLVINELSRAISSTMDLNTMIRIIRDQVPALTSAREIYLALYDAATGDITFPMAIRDGQPFEIAPRVLNSDEVSYVIRNRRLLMLGGDNPRPEEMRRNMGITEGEIGASRYLGVPLAAGDMVAGVLAVRDADVSRPFGLNDQRIMTTIGAQLGAMIQNSNLFARVQNFANELNERVEERTAELQQERDRLDSLYQITSELGRTLDMSSVLNRALDMVANTVNAEEAVVLLLDPSNNEPYARAIRHTSGKIEIAGEDAAYQNGDTYADRKHHPAVMIGSWLMDQHDRIALIPDLKAESFWNVKAAGARKWKSALAVALESEDQPVGALVFFSAQKDAFTDPQLRLVAAAAGQVSSAVKNADLYSLIQNQANRMSNMLQTEREEAEKNSAILEGIADGVLLADSSGVIVLFNAAAERILGIPRDSAIGQPLSDIRGEYGDEPAWVATITPYVMNPPRSGGITPDDDLVANQLDIGRGIVNIRSSPVFNADQFLGTVSLFRDVTKDVEVERMKSEFISNVSHELRTPMTSIKGYADLLLMGAGGGVSPEQERFLQTIKSNADRLAELVNDLLNISKIDAGSEQMTLASLNIRELVEQAITFTTARVDFQRKNVQLETSFADDLPTVTADRIKLLQIVGNIIDNAFNYTHPGGHIAVNVNYDRNREGVLIAVRDDGIGIADEFKPRVWNRFERYDEHALVLDVAGTGLGLAIVKHLVDLHRGDVWFDSQEGKGTTFYILLPVEGPEVGLKRASQPTPESQLAK